MGRVSAPTRQSGRGGSTANGGARGNCATVRQVSKLPTQRQLAIKSPAPSHSPLRDGLASAYAPSVETPAATLVKPAPRFDKASLR